MKTPTHQNQMVRRPFIFAVLLAGIFLVPAARAQPAVRNGDNRFLLIFDTSSDMKQRLPAVQKALSSVLATNANGQLHLNDSIGVWTFDQELQTGQFPLQRWRPDNAATITANISAFAGSQRYAKKTGFDALVPLLNQIVRSSERLTVVIFCDGYGEIHGTPYDTGINQVFQQRQSERQKARLPIVIVLRSQRGQYTGCMVSFPPQPVSLPEFPPLPETVQTPPMVTNAPAPPRSNVPSLIIVGTTITNRVPPPAPKPPSVPNPVLTNLPPMGTTSTPAPVVANEGEPPAIVPLTQTSAVPAQPKIAAVPLTTTNAITPPPESPGIGGKEALAIGVAFLAGGLTVFMFRRARKPGGETPSDSSMKKD
jgi:hypothetical protein